MQVQAKKQPAFQPIELTITIESEEELQALRTITGCDQSIPEVIREWGNNINKAVAGAMLRVIRKSIA